MLPNIAPFYFILFENNALHVVYFVLHFIAIIRREVIASQVGPIVEHERDAVMIVERKIDFLA